MWNIIEAKSMINLIAHFDGIQFSHINVTESDYFIRSPSWQSIFKRSGEHIPTIYKIVIDNLINVHYVHYRLDYRYNKPTVNGIDIYSAKIWEYIVQKYVERTRRMIETHEPPVFVISTAEASYSLEIQQQLIRTVNQTPYKLALITTDIPAGKNDNVSIINFDIKRVNDTTEQAKKLNQSILSMLL
jgi:hypothetical protein